MTTHSLYLGIDFGTTNSSLAWARDTPLQRQGPCVTREAVAFERPDLGASTGAFSIRTPTLVGMSPRGDNDRTLLGWNWLASLLKRARNGVGPLEAPRHGTMFFRSVKSDLGTYKVYPYSWNGDLSTPCDVAAAAIRDLLDKARAGPLADDDIARARVGIGVPAGLSAAARVDTLEAARLAGLTPALVELIDEPVAALADWLNHPSSEPCLSGPMERRVLVFDYGGGTLDLALVRVSLAPERRPPIMVTNLAVSQYHRRGADAIDARLMDKVVWPQIERACGRSREQLIKPHRRSVEDLLIPALVRPLKERLCDMVSERLGSHRGDVEARVRMLRSREMNACRVEASPPSLRRCGVDIDLPRKVTLTAAELAEVTAPCLEEVGQTPEGRAGSLLTPIRETLHAAGVKIEDVDVVLLHGGGTRNPFVRCGLETWLAARSPRCVIRETPSLDASVAYGAAVAVFRRHALGQDLAAPITSSALGVVTHNDQPVEIVPRFASIPFPGSYTFHEVPTDFFVRLRNQPRLVVPFYAGSPDRIVETVTLDLPSGVAVGAVVRLRVRVDRDKGLHWKYSLEGGPWQDAPSVSEVWSARPARREERELTRHRRAMLEQLKVSGRVPKEMLRMELWHLYWAGRDGECDAAIADYVEAFEMSGNIARLTGFRCSDHGRWEESAGWHEQAALLEPTNAYHPAALAHAQAELGRYDQAEASCLRSLTLNPQLHLAHETLSAIWLARGDLSRVREELMQALAVVTRNLARTPGDRYLLLSRSRICHALGEYGEASQSGADVRRLDESDRLGGEPDYRIAGPDSGFLRVEAV